jgi:hypothetical protein
MNRQRERKMTRGQRAIALMLTEIGRETRAAAGGPSDDDVIAEMGKKTAEPLIRNRVKKAKGKTMKRWKLDGRCLAFRYLGMSVEWLMPERYKMPPPQLLRLAEWLMVSPWEDVPEPEPLKPEAFGNRVGLSFSGGVDSTAAMQLFPYCIPVYTERAGIPQRVFCQDAQTRFADAIGAVRVPTDFERIRTAHGFPVGYSTARGMGVPLVLLAEHLRLAGVAYGAVLDDTIFPHGTYRPLTAGWRDRQARFAAAGLHCLSPAIGCSEVITCRIVESGPFADLCQSCIRGGSGAPCGACYKCFRKGLLRSGTTSGIDCPDTLRATAKNPPKMAGPLIWGLRRHAIAMPGMEYAGSIDVSFLERYSQELTAEGMPMESEARNVENILYGYGFMAMTREHVAAMEAADFRRPEA